MPLHRAPLLLLGALLCFAQEGTAATTTPSTEVTVRILGDQAATLPKDITVWGGLRLALFDSIEYVIGTQLNGAISGTTTPAPSEEDSSTTWKFWLPIGLIGGALLLIIGLFIWFGVDFNQLYSKIRHGGSGGGGPKYSQFDSNAPEEGRAYPPPRPDSKVIQIPLVNYRVAPLAPVC